MNKRCCTCKETKSTEEFGSDKSSKDSFCPRCSICENKRGREKYKALSPEKKLKKRLKVYNLTIREYEELCHLHNGNCALCGKVFGEEVPFIDHCHRSGKIRGLLHIQCNSIIGHAQDDVRLLQQSIEYLQKN